MWRSQTKIWGKAKRVSHKRHTRLLVDTARLVGRRSVSKVITTKLVIRFRFTLTYMYNARLWALLFTASLIQRDP